MKHDKLFDSVSASNTETTNPTPKRSSQRPTTTRAQITVTLTTEPATGTFHKRPYPGKASPLIREIVESERYEGNGPPHWKVRRTNKRCQTAEEAEQQRYKLTKRLRGQGKANPEALALADRLEACDRGYRCLSGACPECVRIVQRWLVASGYTYLKGLGVEVAAVSVVPDDLAVPIGQFSPEVLSAMATRIGKALRKAGITTIIGGFDFSANEHEANEYAPYYQPQYWGLAPLDEFRKAKRQLRTLFPGTDKTPRSIKITKWNGKRRALAYALKSEFNRRVSYHVDTNEHRSREGHWNTRQRELRVEQQIELMIALDRAGLDARLLLRGARIVRTNHGPMIRPITKLGSCSVKSVKSVK